MATLRKGVNHMRKYIVLVCRFSACFLTRSVLVAGIVLAMQYNASAQELAVSEETFGCILDWPKIRNTYFKHADPQKLKEAMRIFRDRVPEQEYPVGTILQLVPFEAMVKHPHEKFPNSNGWEFFALEVSEAGTKIRDRGDKVVNLLLATPCLTCHQPAARFDFVCEKGHGCAPLPIDDQKIAEFQKADLRCKKK